jgi:transcription elongation factor/antiterminator RfaH
MSPVSPAAAACERWYVVRTLPRAEERAAFNLNKQGYHIFCPRLWRTIRHARTTRTLLWPLFPSYLFVRFDPRKDRWRCINGTRGVMHLVGQTDTPEPVPTEIVEELLAHTGADGATRWTSSLRVGVSVRISRGPFANFVGVLEHADDAGRVRVLLQLFARSVTVGLPSNALAPAA